MAFNWNPYIAPKQEFVANPIGATNGNYGFITPSDTKLPTRGDLTQFLTGGGTLGSDAITNRTVKYDGGLTREMMGNTTGFLNQQMGTGFEGIQNSLDQYAQYGGAFGDKNSPVYSPQSKNGYGSAWGNNNPFKIGSF